MVDRRAAIRLVVGFLLSLAFWFPFSSAYERAVAPASEFLIRLVESPAITRLEAPGGEFEVKRSDIPPGKEHPGVPAPDIHFNFVLLGALFALPPRPWRSENVLRFLLAALCLFCVHVVFLIFGVESLYATRFTDSAVRYGPIARNFWAAGFHFYQIAGRFAAPFAIWWFLGRTEPVRASEQARGGRRRRKRRT
jgi:hypothetical protein